MASRKEPAYCAMFIEQVEAVWRARPRRPRCMFSFLLVGAAARPSAWKELRCLLGGVVISASKEAVDQAVDHQVASQSHSRSVCQPRQRQASLTMIFQRQVRCLSEVKVQAMGR